MSKGWVKLHRRLVDWEWYDDINTSRLFIHLMLTVNHKDGKWRGIDIKRGSRLTSLDKLSCETNLSVSKIRTALKKLISTSEIASQSHSQHTVFTVINYEVYQANDKQDDKSVAEQSQTDDKGIATNKNGKNENNDQEVKKTDLLSGNPDSILVLQYLNDSLDSKYKATTKSHIANINARLSEGHSVDDCKLVVDAKKLEWGNDPSMAQYLRPQTLFSSKFQGYLIAAKTPPKPMAAKSIHSFEDQNYQSGKF